MYENTHLMKKIKYQKMREIDTFCKGTYKCCCIL